MGHIDVLVALDQFFFFSGLLQAARKLRYLLPKKLKNPHLFYSYGRFSGKHSVAVKHFKRERRFRLLNHIPHILVDDGALFPFSPSGTDTTSVH